MESGGCRQQRRSTRTTPVSTGSLSASASTTGSLSASTSRWSLTGPRTRRFPTERTPGTYPNRRLLAVEWYLPLVDVVPKYKAFRHIKTRKVIEPRARPVAEIRQLYQSVIAQIACGRCARSSHSTPEDMISTVVFNGRVHDIDPLTGQKIQPHLITLRATREQFTPLILDEPKFNPVECVRRYFFADISPHPDELIPVEPVMPFSMADPRDHRPDRRHLRHRQAPQPPRTHSEGVRGLHPEPVHQDGLRHQAVPGQRRRRHRLRRLRPASHHRRQVHRPGQAVHPHRRSQPMSATCGAPCSTRAPPRAS